MSEASFSEQLISAYVDGQLTGDELAQAEKLITENTHLAELAEQWRVQGQQISELPRFELDSNFADRVLAAAAQKKPVALQSEDGPAVANIPSPSSFPGGRYAFASIVSLAAMILVTLFIFPNLFDNEAGVAKVVPEAGVVDEDNVTQNKDKKRDGVSEEKNSIGVDSDASDKAADIDLDANQKSNLKNGNVVTDQIASSAMANQPVQVAETDQTESEQNNGAAQIAKNQLAGSQQRRMAPAENEESQPAPIEMKFLEAGKNVDQFILVELEAGESLEQFEDVLKRNQIQFGASGGNSRARSLQSKSTSDIEMLHVYSSPSQMVGAINELSQNNLAKIHGYRIPSRSDYAVASNMTSPRMAAVQQGAPMRMSKDDGAGGREQADAQMAQATQFKKESQHISPPAGFGMKVQPSMRISKDSDAAKGAGQNTQRVVETVLPTENNKQDSGKTDDKSDESDLSKINEWFGLDRNLGQPAEKMQQYLLLIKVKPMASDADTESSKSENSDK